MNNTLETFFDKTFETKINYNLLDNDYQLPVNDIINYVIIINNIPISDFLEWIEKHSFYVLSSNDMPQISKFEDSFYNIVYKFISIGDPGLRYIEIGKLLQNDGITRTDIANRKYGENHAKTSAYLGYLFNIKYYYYVSCLGKILDYISEDDKEKLFTRCLLRTNLFKSIYLTSLYGKVLLKDIFEGIFTMGKTGTYARRLSGTKQILNNLLNSKEYDFSGILDKLEY